MLQNSGAASPPVRERKGLAGDEQASFCFEGNLKFFGFSAKADTKCDDGNLGWPSGLRVPASVRVSRLAVLFLAAALAAPAAAQQAPRLAAPAPVQATPAPSQGDPQKTASLAVRIKDQTDALIPNARVILTRVSTLVRVAEGQTDKAGELYLAKLAPGVYSIEVEFPGFTMTRQNVVLAAGVLSKVDVHGNLQISTGEVVIAPKHPVLNKLSRAVRKIRF